MPLNTLAQVAFVHFTALVCAWWTAPALADTPEPASGVEVLATGAAWACLTPDDLELTLEPLLETHPLQVVVSVSPAVDGLLVVVAARTTAPTCGLPAQAVLDSPPFVVVEGDCPALAETVHTIVASWVTCPAPVEPVRAPGPRSARSSLTIASLGGAVGVSTTHQAPSAAFAVSQLRSAGPVALLVGGALEVGAPMELPPLAGRPGEPARSGSVHDVSLLVGLTPAAGPTATLVPAFDVALGAGLACGRSFSHDLCVVVPRSAAGGSFRAVVGSFYAAAGVEVPVPPLVYRRVPDATALAVVTAPGPLEVAEPWLRATLSLGVAVRRGPPPSVGG